MAEKIIPQDFYVYVHRKATTGAVFYIGKGTGRRALSKHGRSDQWDRIVKKHGLIVEILHKGFQEWYAHEKEQELIALYGRKDLGLGPLINYTDGGEGISGVIHSKESIKKMSDSKKGMLLSEEHKKKLSFVKKGKPIHKNTKSALIAANKGKPLSSLTKMKMSISKKGVPKSEKARNAMIYARMVKEVFCDQTEQTFQTQECAAKWLRANGKEKARAATVGACCNGRVKTAYGYTWRYLDNMPQTA